jgi:uncharacterized protein
VRTLAFTALLLVSGCKLDGFLYTPPRVDSYKLEPEGKTPIETVSADRIEALQIQVSPEVTVQAAYIKGSVQPPKAYVLFFHGKGGTIDNNFGRAKRWSNMGYDVLIWDYRGFGASTNVTPTEEGIEDDSEAVLQTYLARIGDSARLVFYGHSFGCAVNLQRAVINPPRAVIIESPFASIQDFVADSSRMDVPQSFISADGWSNEERIARLQAPVLLMHGLVDDYVRPEGSRILYGEAKDPKQLVLVEEADHGGVPARLDEQFAAGKVAHDYAGTVSAFLDAYAP